MLPTKTTAPEKSSSGGHCNDRNRNAVVEDSAIHRSTNIKVWTKYLHSPAKPFDSLGISQNKINPQKNGTQRGLDIVNGGVDEDTKRQEKLDQLHRNCKNLFAVSRSKCSDERGFGAAKPRENFRNNLVWSNVPLGCGADTSPKESSGYCQEMPDFSKRYIIKSDGLFKIRNDHFEERGENNEVDVFSEKCKEVEKDSAKKVRFDNIRGTDNNVQMEGKMEDANKDVTAMSHEKRITRKDEIFERNSTHKLGASGPDFSGPSNATIQESGASRSDVTIEKSRASSDVTIEEFGASSDVTIEESGASSDATLEESGASSERRGEVQAGIDSLNECIDEFTRLVHGEDAPQGRERNGDFIKELLKFRF